ncbi:hypothetical protein OIU78_020791 [Salix suchowensis]|nr:hypothetical protein OIU78_020791 [Salix suchowensis]
MSGFLAFLKSVFFGIEEREEDHFGSSYYRSVERNNDRVLHRSSKCTYPPIYSDDLPASSSALTQSSSKLLYPCSIPAPPWPKTPASSSYQTVLPPTKVSYLSVQRGVSPIYAVPKNMEDLIKRDIVPQVLNEPLSPSTYKDYFAALLFAEDFYVEKWSQFQLEKITLKLQEAAIIKKSGRNEYFSKSHEKYDKTFVEFEIDSCRERRPFLLSRDFALARPSGQQTEPYQGVIYRVVKNNIVLVEFGEDFYLQHHSTRKYDVSFSFNRVCLKRAHQAIEAASDPSFKKFLFPGFAHRKSIPTSTPLQFFNHKLDVCQRSAVQEILSFQGPAPYVVEGPLCSQKYSQQLSRTGYVAQKAGLSRTGLVVQEAVLQIYQRSSKHRILICAPINRTCDDLMQSLKNDIPESDMFRANAAFREIDGVPIDILTSSTEPETMVALANFAGENTAVIVTGAPGNRPGWVRSNIAREKGLMRSYFERIRDSQPYSSLHPKFIKQLVDPESKSFDSYSYARESLSYD